jgi:hypothetical protein
VYSPPEFPSEQKVRALSSKEQRADGEIVARTG